MKRHTFIKTTILAVVSFILCPQLSIAQLPERISEKELIGKGSPKLFGNGYKLRREAHNAFLKMKAAAAKENITIQVVSSYRSFAHQKRIWERKFKNYKTRGLSDSASIKKIIEYSTIPGTSRHHWGTDIDIIDAAVKQPKHVLNEKHFHNNGAFCKLKEWLDKHANTYGFYLVYTDNYHRKGFKYEPWHYSYKPLSSNYLKAYKTIDIKQLLKQEHLSGINAFSEEFTTTYHTQNILDINPELL